MQSVKNQIDNGEDENVKKLRTLVEAITHSGANALDEDLFKQVKKICKSSPAYIQESYNLILGQLRKKNSQIRFIAFEMCKELFTRSAMFREQVTKDLELIFKLTAEINSKSGLPPPKTFAQNLKALAIRTLQMWVNDYGNEYKQLKIAHNYLKNCKGITFEGADARSVSERVREDENENRLRALFDERMKRTMDEVAGYQTEIDETITSLSNCFNLLLPTPENFFIPDDRMTSDANQEAGFNNVEVDDEELNHTDLRSFGITTDYSLKLELNLNENIKISKTEENSSIIQNAKDCVQLINNRYLPMIKKWSQIISKCSNGSGNQLAKILDLRGKLMNAMEKYKALNIDDDISKNNEKKNSDNEEIDDDDEDFEEVKKEGYEDSVEFTEADLLNLPCLKSQASIAPEKSSRKRSFTTCSQSHEDEDRPSASTSREVILESNDRKSKLLKVAPKIPFDIDLYHWEDETLKAPTLISTKIDVDKFWGCASSDDIHEIPNPEGVAALRTRVIEFTGKFEPVKWSCRAPLSNGKLCPRKDRYKCPFHGKIVPRDEKGICENPEDEKSKKGEGTSVPDWQDPQLLADLKEATGLDLKLREGKRKKNSSKDDNLTQRQMKTSAAALKLSKSKNHPGLIDVVRKRNNTYTRLSKKLFNKSTMRRMSAAMNKIDSKKHRDKFGDNFNY